MISVVSSGRCGDILYSIPTCLGLAQNSNTSICYYLNAEAEYDDLEDGRQKRLSTEAANSLMELLGTQPFISSVKLYNGESVNINFDFFRKLSGSMSCGDLARKYFSSFESWFDLSKPWLIAGKNNKYKNKIVINRTARYNNPTIDYGILSKYKPIFIGSAEEYEKFNKMCPCDKVHTNTLYDAACIVNSSRFFVGNTSSCFAIAEGLKVPRCLENFNSNVIPSGGMALDATNQLGFTWSIKYLMENT